MSRRVEDFQSDSDSDKELKKHKNEVGIPTVFTPVPSNALPILNKERFEALNASKKPIFIFVRGFFNGKLKVAFEISQDRTVEEAGKFVYSIVKEEINNDYTIYARPYEKSPQFRISKRDRDSKLINFLEKIDDGRSGTLDFMINEKQVTSERLEDGF